MGFADSSASSDQITKTETSDVDSLTGTATGITRSPKANVAEGNVINVRGKGHNIGFSAEDVANLLDIVETGNALQHVGQPAYIPAGGTSFFPSENQPGAAPPSAPGDKIFNPLVLAGAGVAIFAAYSIAKKAF